VDIEGPPFFGPATIAPSPLAKKVIAAAATSAHVEQRAPEILAPLENALQRNAADLAKPIIKHSAGSRGKHLRASAKIANFSERPENDGENGSAEKGVQIETALASRRVGPARCTVAFLAKRAPGDNRPQWGCRAQRF